MLQRNIWSFCLC